MINILIAYPYMKPNVVKLLKDNKQNIRFLLDSGAFTAWKSGKQISLDDYCRFIESLPFVPFGYFMLDVIGNPGATMKNYEIMLKRGFKPIPIFTRGEDLSVLDDYYKTSDIVAIGGLVGTQGNKGFVKGIMNKVSNRKCHWLGFFNFEFVKYYKPYSCDSSTWKVGSTYKNFCYFDENKIGKVMQCNQRDLLNIYNSNKSFRKTCVEFDIHSFSKLIEIKNNNKLLSKFNIKQFIKIQKLVDLNLNTKYFIAVSNLDTLMDFIL